MIRRGPKVDVPVAWRRSLAHLGEVAKAQRLRHPAVTLYAHKWLREGREDVWAAAYAKGRDEVVIRMRVDDEQADHTLIHEMAHAITNLVCKLPTTSRHDQHPPVFWAIHGMLYGGFFR